MSEKQRKGFVYGALILSLSGFVCKLIGAVFRIPLTNLVGSAAMSYYSSAYSVYNVLLSLATSGIPTGIAAMVSRSVAVNKLKDTKAIVLLSFQIFVSFGALLTVVGMLFSENIAVLMNSEEATPSVFWIMPAVFFIAVVSVFKGFFQGYNNMVPTAVSNVIEAVVKLFLGYGIASWMHLNGFSDSEVVGGAILGVTLGTLLAMLYLFVRYLFRGKEYRIPAKNMLEEPEPERKKLLRDLLMISFPIMVSSITANLMSAVDAFVVMNRLKSFTTLESAKLLWGAYGNMSLTVFNLPSFLIINIGISLVPSISAAFALKDSRRIKATTGKALKYSSVLAFGCAFGLSAVSRSTLLLLFSGDLEGVEVATPLLEVISFALIAVGLTNVTASILQAVGKAYLPVISVGIGTLVKTVVTYILVGIPEIGVMGAPIATNIAYPIMMIFNLYFIKKYLKMLPKFSKTFVKPFAAGLACYATARVTLGVLDNVVSPKIAVFPAILAAVIVYIALIILLRVVSVREILQTFSRKRKKLEKS